jgi:integrase
LPPERGKVTLRDYAAQWLAQKPNLRPRSREQYEIALRRHIFPRLGERELSQISPSIVRSWHASLQAAGQVGAPTIAKAYRLLHAVLATAAEDELIAKNPCLLRGASTDRTAERPVATVEQVYLIADAIEPSLRAMVLFATSTGLRLGELRALKRRRLDLKARSAQVVEQYQELSSGDLVLGPPKTQAGYRTVAIPEALMPELRKHLERNAGSGPDGLVFCGSLHQPLNRKTFYRHWNSATIAAGLEGFHFHDLRHTGNTLAAATGASTKELMSRMGHASPRAALIYQHASTERDHSIAAALSSMIVQRVAVGDLPASRSSRRNG